VSIRIFADFCRILSPLRQNRPLAIAKSSLKNAKKEQFLRILLIFSTSSSFGFASIINTDDVVELEKLEKVKEIV
jgi:hypothetical protein